MRHSNLIRHFPIVLTEDHRYYIGKHHFKTLENIIIYYKNGDLFVDANGSGVRLGCPLVIPEVDNQGYDITC